jgi:hypothetical protein
MHWSHHNCRRWRISFVFIYLKYADGMNFFSTDLINWTCLVIICSRIRLKQINIASKIRSTVETSKKNVAGENVKKKMSKQLWSKKNVEHIKCRKFEDVVRKLCWFSFLSYCPLKIHSHMFYIWFFSFSSHMFHIWPLVFSLWISPSLCFSHLCSSLFARAISSADFFTINNDYSSSHLHS